MAPARHVGGGDVGLSREVSEMVDRATERVLLELPPDHQLLATLGLAGPANLKQRRLRDQTALLRAGGLGGGAGGNLPVLRQLYAATLAAAVAAAVDGKGSAEPDRGAMSIWQKSAAVLPREPIPKPATVAEAPAQLARADRPKEVRDVGVDARPEEVELGHEELDRRSTASFDEEGEAELESWVRELEAAARQGRVRSCAPEEEALVQDGGSGGDVPWQEQGGEPEPEQWPEHLCGPANALDEAGGAAAVRWEEQGEGGGSGAASGEPASGVEAERGVAEVGEGDAGPLGGGASGPAARVEHEEHQQGSGSEAAPDAHASGAEAVLGALMVELDEGDVALESAALGVRDGEEPEEDGAASPGAPAAAGEEDGGRAAARRRQPSDAAPLLAVAVLQDEPAVDQPGRGDEGLGPADARRLTETTDWTLTYCRQVYGLQKQRRPRCRAGEAARQRAAVRIQRCWRRWRRRVLRRRAAAANCELDAPSAALAPSPGDAVCAAGAAGEQELSRLSAEAAAVRIQSAQRGRQGRRIAEARRPALREAAEEARAKARARAQEAASDDLAELRGLYVDQKRKRAGKLQVRGGGADRTEEDDVQRSLRMYRYAYHVERSAPAPASSGRVVTEEAGTALRRVEQEMLTAAGTKRLVLQDAVARKQREILELSWQLAARAHEADQLRQLLVLGACEDRCSECDAKVLGLRNILQALGDTCSAVHDSVQDPGGGDEVAHRILGKVAESLADTQHADPRLAGLAAYLGNALA